MIVSSQLGIALNTFFFIKVVHPESEDICDTSFICSKENVNYDLNRG